MLVLVIVFRSSEKARHFLFKGKKIKMLIIAYGVLLLVGLPVYFLNSPSGHVEGVDQADVNQLMDEDTNLFDAAIKGETDRLKQHLVERKEFPIDGDELTINLLENQETNLLVIVEKVSDKASSIQASYYASPIYVNDVKVEVDRPFPYVSIEDGNMVISDSKPIHLEFSTFEKEFVVRQFTEPAGIGTFGGMSSSFSSGVNLLYLRVPELINVVGDVQFVE